MARLMARTRTGFTAATLRRLWAQVVAYAARLARTLRPQFKAFAESVRGMATNLPDQEIFARRRFAIRDSVRDSVKRVRAATGAEGIREALLVGSALSSRREAPTAANTVKEIDQPASEHEVKGALDTAASPGRLDKADALPVYEFVLVHEQESPAAFPVPFGEYLVPETPAHQAGAADGPLNGMTTGGSAEDMTSISTDQSIYVEE